MHEITENYKKNQTRFDDFKIKAEVLIRELLVQHGVNYHKIESRVKDPINLDEKITRKNDKYKNLEDITDLVGIRVIAYFEDEVDKIASIINSEFIVDDQNTIDKRKLETDRFGYKSFHYVVSLSDQRKKLTEYKRFKDIKIEIQIRSILQHAWAEIEHDMGYKGENTVPYNVRRSFFRVAALLETADIEFVNIKNSLLLYEKTVTENIKHHPEDVEINGPSLLSFIHNNETVGQLDRAIGVIANKTPNAPEIEFTSNLVDKLRYLGIENIKALANSLDENKGFILPFIDKWVGENMIGHIVKGISIFYLCYIIVAKKDDIHFSKAYIGHFFSQSLTDIGSDINNIYNEIK